MKQPFRFTDFDLPCADPETMDDWHVDEKPKLYDEERAELLAEIRLSYPRLDEQAQAKKFLEIEAEILADMKLRRRRALQKCYFDCPMRARLQCLDLGLQPINLEHGIMGGYPESERRAMFNAIRNRKGLTTRKAAEVVISEERAAAMAEAEELRRGATTAG